MKRTKCTKQIITSVDKPLLEGEADGERLRGKGEWKNEVEIEGSGKLGISMLSFLIHWSFDLDLLHYPNETSRHSIYHCLLKREQQV